MSQTLDRQQAGNAYISKVIQDKWSTEAQEKKVTLHKNLVRASIANAPQ